MVAARQGLIVGPRQQAERVHPRSAATLAPDSGLWCFSFVVGLIPPDPRSPPKLLSKKLEAEAKKWEPVPCYQVLPVSSTVRGTGTSGRTCRGPAIRISPRGGRFCSPPIAIGCQVPSSRAPPAAAQGGSVRRQGSCVRLALEAWCPGLSSAVWSSVFPAFLLPGDSLACAVFVPCSAPDLWGAGLVS